MKRFKELIGVAKDKDAAHLFRLSQFLKDMLKQMRRANELNDETLQKEIFKTLVGESLKE